jgi:hypothetical protein
MESRRGNSKNSFGMSGVVSLDSLIGQSLANISQSDREQTYFDLHGVTVPVTETPNFITESLQQMQSTLDGIKDKPAYDLAYSMDAEYVQDLKFRLKFLRGERFDTRMAAKRMVRYFQIKEDLFNSSKLCKDIDQSDMSEEDIDALYGGWMQHMTEKDSSGRMVLLWFAGAKARKISVLSGMRVCFYLRMLALEDIEVQKKGFVAIALEDNERQNDFVSSKIQSGKQPQFISDSLEWAVTELIPSCIVMNQGLVFLMDYPGLLSEFIFVHGKRIPSKDISFHWYLDWHF